MTNVIPFCEPVVYRYADAVHQILDANRAGPGWKVETFADALKTLTGAPYVLMTTSGTAALQIAAKVIGLLDGSTLRRRDTVCIPAYGEVATANAFASLGLQLRLVDIDQKTGCMSPESLAVRLVGDVSAVCYVNFSGRTDESLGRIRDMCAAENVPLIEDAACGLGHSWQGQHAGTFGRIGILSFSVPKIVTMGQGGALLFQYKRDYERARALICQGDPERTGLSERLGANYRLTDMQAALGCAHLIDLAELQSAKRNAQALMACHGAPSGPLLHNIIFAAQADKTVERLHRRGIDAKRNYRMVSEHPIHADLRGLYPGAQWWRDHAVYLPFGNALTVEQAERIARALEKEKRAA